MVLLLLGVAAVASVAGKAAFDYNRENFQYDRDLRQKKELNTLKYRVPSCYEQQDAIGAK
eukprot:460100-Amphidinium_carterae.1